MISYGIYSFSATYLLPLSKHTRTYFNTLIPFETRLHPDLVIEQGHFTPLILSTSGGTGMGPECAIFVKHLAKKIAQKKNQDLQFVIEIRFQICSAKGHPHRHQRNQRQPLPEEDGRGC